MRLIGANERRGLQRVAHMVKKRGRVSKLIPIIQRLLSKLLSPRSYFNAVTTVARFLLNKFEGRPNQLSSSSHAVPGNFDVDHHRRGAGQSVANARVPVLFCLEEPPARAARGWRGGSASDPDPMWRL